VKGLSEKILLGSYDHTVQLWSATAAAVEDDEESDSRSKPLAVLPGHTGAVKAVAWISSASSPEDQTTDKFISASHDQSLIIWEWNNAKQKLESTQRCVGHKESVDCVDVNNDKTKFISGSWDRMLKLWSTSDDDNVDGSHQEEADVESQHHIVKKSKTSDDVAVRVKTPKTPIITLSGHTESVSSCKWLDDNQACTASWDHTIRLWDVYVGQQQQSLSSGTKIFLCVDYSPLRRLIVAGLNDRHVRLYDPRSTEGNIVKATMTSHTGWCTAVCWSKTNDNLLVSGSHDTLSKLWDIRNPKMPIFELFGHEDKVLCVDWASQSNLILSGSADNTLKMFMFNG